MSCGAKCARIRSGPARQDCRGLGLRAGRVEQERFGRPSIRHPAFGARICLGLPEEIAHIAMAHSGKGELLVRSLACMIVHQANYTFWNTLLAGGQLKPETVAVDKRRYVMDRPL